MRSLCRGCDRMFASLGGFEEHRIGSYGEAIYKPNDTKRKQPIGHTKHTRHCMSEEELVSAGFVSRQQIVPVVIEGISSKQERIVWYSAADLKRESLRGTSDEEEESDE